MCVRACVCACERFSGEYGEKRTGEKNNVSNCNACPT